MKKVLLFWVALMLVALTLPAQDRVQDRDQVRLQDHLVLKDGTMYQIKDRQQIQLREQITLQNGATVNPDGTYRLRNGRQLRLRDGECLAMDGKRFRSEERFMARMDQRNRERMNAENRRERMRPDTRPERGRRGNL